MVDLLLRLKKLLPLPLPFTSLDKWPQRQEDSISEEAQKPFVVSLGNGD
jgi:hypothetical protein